MRVICCYVDLQPDTAEALDESGHAWEAWDVSGSDSAYWEVFAELWREGRGFINVEHDVVIRPDTIRELEDCPQPWCGFAIPYYVGDYPGLACAKFGPELIAARPLALEEVAAISDPTHPAKHWCRLDGWLQFRVLPATGIQRHIHEPPLGHYRADGLVPYPTHGCIQREATA